MLANCGFYEGGNIVQEVALSYGLEDPDAQSFFRGPTTQEGCIISMIADSNLQLSWGHRRCP